MKKSILILILMAASLFAQSCVFRGFNAYAADLNGGTYRQGGVIYLPWPVVYEHYEHCTPQGETLVCIEKRMVDKNEND